MYNEALRNISVTPAVLQQQQQEMPELFEANSEGRNYQVATADLGDLGIEAYRQNGVYVYAGTEQHPHLCPIKPDYVFDNVELDRLITVVINREWERLPSAPRRGIQTKGPKGVGKTSYFRQRLARQGIPTAVISWGPDSTAADAVYTKSLVGSDIVYEPGILWQAMVGGYPAIIEEINSGNPAQLIALNDLIDVGFYTIPETGEVIRAKRGFCVFATCNPEEGYAGTRQQNQAVEDRFWSFWMHHASDEKEKAFILAIKPDMEPEVAASYATFISMLHKASDSSGAGVNTATGTHRLSLDFGRRNLLDWFELIDAFSYLESPDLNVPLYALRPVYTERLADHEKATVEHLFKLAFGITG